MPIVKNFGPTENSSVVYLGRGDVHLLHAFYIDEHTLLPELNKSMVMFSEFDPKDMVKPGVSLVFEDIRMLDAFIETMQRYKQEYLKHLQAATQRGGQA
jgi:hypothetical protein